MTSTNNSVWNSEKKSIIISMKRSVGDSVWDSVRNSVVNSSINARPCVIQKLKEYDFNK
jgi:hypothetical protein